MQKNLRFDLVKALHKKMKFSIKDFYNKWNKIRRKLRIWSDLLKKSWMEDFIFCAVKSKKILFKPPWYGENTLTYKFNKQIYRNIFLR